MQPDYVSQRIASARHHLGKTRRALEIGCGVGRLTFPHAAMFDEVYAVDSVPTLLELLELEAESRSVTNVTTFLSDAAWDVPNSIDYAYSFLVFQHIADYALIDSYIRRTAQALVPGGIAHFQFDTRPSTALYLARNLVPTMLLPVQWQPGMRRIRRDRAELFGSFGRAGLKVIDEVNAHSALQTFVLRKD